MTVVVRRNLGGGDSMCYVWDKATQLTTARFLDGAGGDMDYGYMSYNEPNLDCNFAQKVSTFIGWCCDLSVVQSSHTEDKNTAQFTFAYKKKWKPRYITGVSEVTCRSMHDGKTWNVCPKDNVIYNNPPEPFTLNDSSEADLDIIVQTYGLMLGCNFKRVKISKNKGYIFKRIYHKQKRNKLEKGDIIGFGFRENINEIVIDIYDTRTGSEVKKMSLPSIFDNFCDFKISQIANCMAVSAGFSIAEEWIGPKYMKFKVI